MDNDDLKQLAEWLRKCQLEKAAEAFEHFLSIVYGWFVSLNGSLRPSAALS